MFQGERSEHGVESSFTKYQTKAASLFRVLARIENVVRKVCLFPRAMKPFRRVTQKTRGKTEVRENTLAHKHKSTHYVPLKSHICC